MQLRRWIRAACAIMAVGAINLTVAGRATADVQPGDTITKENMDKADNLLIPTIKWYVEHGMPIKVIPYRKVELPRLYKAIKRPPRSMRPR